MEKTPEERLAALELRMASLERRLDADTSPYKSFQQSFWMLSQLQEHQFDGVAFAGHVSLSEENPIQWQYSLDTQTIINQEWQDASHIFGSLSSPIRLKILRAILSGRVKNSELSELEDMGSTGQLYHHLKDLASAGWIRSLGRGKHTIVPEKVVPLLIMLAATETLSITKQEIL